MTLQELKKMSRREVAKWCDGLPQDGDYSNPELITDRWAGDGAPQDGDYALIVLFHNRNEEGDAE